MADVFVSYKSEERAWAEKVVAKLHAADFSTWYDRKLTPQKSWNKLIEQELKAAKAVLVLWTPASVESDYVIEEAQRAKEAGKLVPAICIACQLPYGFGSLQTADLTGWTGEAAALSSAAGQAAKPFLGAGKGWRICCPIRAKSRNL